VYLLHPRAFLWFLWDDVELSKKGKDQIQQTPNCYVSMVSLWEISIKTALGTLTLPAPFPHYIPQQLGTNQFKVLPIFGCKTSDPLDRPESKRD
jgi:PIN domain nuclease of toxin-antitoxin system